MLRGLFILLVFFSILYANDNQTKLLYDPSYLEYVDNITKVLKSKHNVPEKFSKSILLSLKIDNATIEKITTPKEALIWGRYKKIFITDKRLSDAKKFLEEHRELLSEIEKEFNVDKEIIVALVAIESNFGKYKPVHNVGDALFTLAKGYPPRSQFFTKELIYYILLRYLDKTYDNDTLKGSYAGAIGLPQFMPSSILNYGIDYNNDCRMDLINDWKDVFASIANYLKLNGWIYKDPIAKQIKPDDINIFLPYLNKSPTFELDKLGYLQAKNRKAIVRKFDNENDFELWLTYKNYDVIKTYNRSDNYALTAYLIYESLLQ
ncbi:lytic murein transglycosylase [Calditerrivibrio nitroreducens]|uniref:Membrane-bound lytic murein transglycosylase B n=1 Tax=Calditerrivibrio nitroreducens (strain DSM 19672 / NBRC 101217 / Yu37-1) TaxID=768670 RepID=E4TI06_CALNY|nr:lytic murein transglycosylase [Calditerrivibrio nitroreducens]ADR18936.1 membrane-bound lytic murein transglycosylase B [Calditerrivibrio nitroreducens DSM 19672]